MVHDPADGLGVVAAISKQGGVLIGAPNLPTGQLVENIVDYISDLLERLRVSGQPRKLPGADQSFIGICGVATAREGAVLIDHPIDEIDNPVGIFFFLGRKIALVDLEVRHGSPLVETLGSIAVGILTPCLVDVNSVHLFGRLQQQSVPLPEIEVVSCFHKGQQYLSVEVG